MSKEPEDRYMILQYDSLTVMCDMANQCVSEGWRPLGGVQYQQWGGNYPGRVYTQAFTYTESEDEPKGGEFERFKS